MSQLTIWVKGHLHHLIHSNTSEHSIGLGFALGTFLNIVLPFVSIPITVLLLIFYKSLNKLSFLASLAFWNPFTLPPVYLLSYAIGDLFFGPLPPFKVSSITLHNALDVSSSLLLGNLIVGSALAFSMYFLLKHGVMAFRRRKNLSLQKQ